ncbi:hypothetical protein [Oryzicola mucosus]|uniref:Uncharacterized protein n=1 Tax=Oryzicola mucosus TaxID=2767425 RepID=A0A8J6PHN6_9HYPH|nr:hypothetical protein [Oryzicola mucosus]MBD0413676.1 hypothetical protein [Oryzicola mucosus]
MAGPRPISGAPRDGSKVTVRWTSGDGVENESLAQFRSDDNGTGWWAYVDSDTQKRIEPHSWLPEPGEELESDE